MRRNWRVANFSYWLLLVLGTLHACHAADKLSQRPLDFDHLTDH